MPAPRIVIIGAGMAGIACARALADAGLAPIVVDKGRSPGGRMSTRRAEGLTFDHGAQYFTARGARFRSAVQQAEAAGAVAAWAHAADADPRDPHLVGLPGMSGIVKHLAEGLDVRCGIEVTSVARDGEGWAIHHAGGVLHADRLVCTAPLPQTRNLLGPQGWEAMLVPFDMAPCWALMLGFAQPFDPGFTTRRGDGPLAWVARDGSKPGRSGESWVVHAAPEWSREHLELTKEAAADRLLAAVAEACGPLPDLAYVAAHRWRYAMVSETTGVGVLAKDGVFAGGDWALGPRVECAFDSGCAIADAVLREI